jgi:hypothetical protein
MHRYLFIFILLLASLALLKWGKNLDSSLSKLEKKSTIASYPALLVRSYFQVVNKQRFLVLSYIADTDKEINITKLSLNSGCEYRFNLKPKAFEYSDKKIKLSKLCQMSKPIIEFTINGSSTHKSKILHSHSNELFDSDKKNIINGDYTFSAGTHNISDSWVFTETSNVTFIKGSILKFKEGASLSIHGKAQFPDAGEASVKMIGHNWGGLLINTKEKVKVSSLLIEGGTDFNNDSRSTSGSISIHNSSSISLTNIIIKSSIASDSIHVKDSNIIISKTTIFDSHGDAIDFDRSTGSISNITILNTGGDAIDFYNSNLKLKNIKINDCKDKGLSVGEMSKVIVDSYQISNCNIAIALKDDSEIISSNKKLSKNKTTLLRLITSKLYSSPGTLNESL